jgi:trans-aconitate methyltransferase
MTDLNRENSALARRAIRALLSLLTLLLSLLKRQITARQFILDLRFRLISKKDVQNDDFDWEIYPSYYKEELKSISRIHTLNIEGGNFSFKNGELVKVDPLAKNLHANHAVLYKIVANLRPESVLEVGCGGGDHLSNINQLCPEIKLYGVDRSDEQLVTLRERHPQMPGETRVVDITNYDEVPFTVSLVYTQAVLMHISESESRFNKAMDFVFSSAQETVVLVENWTQHNFLKEVTRIQAEFSDWAESHVYADFSKEDFYASALVVSKKPIQNLRKLISYDELLVGRKIQIH